MLKKVFSKISIHAILIATSLLSIFPFIWLTSTSLKGVNEDIFAYPPTIIPQDCIAKFNTFIASCLSVSKDAV